jgi:hypothetical protein
MEARLFYRAAQQRLLDARVLQDNSRTTGAVYLSGYGVECILKALILTRLTGKARRTVAESFRGSKAHDFAWLRHIYFKNHGDSLPADVASAFVLVATWSTNLRYHAGAIPRVDAEAFRKAAEAIFNWAGRRL